MAFKELIAIATIVGISSLSLSASATEIVIRTACLSPTQGEGMCELGVDPANTNIWNITWQDGTKIRTRLSDRSDRNSTPFQRWNSQNNQWVNLSSFGFCLDRRCINFTSALLSALDRQASRITIDCLDPTLGDGTCQAEYVPSTDGIRVYWPDSSIEHYRFRGGGFPLKWSHAQNAWVRTPTWGICFDGSCLLFDSQAANPWRNN
jgi:hypothetical protein